jgi:hypothetical protein
MKHAAPFVAVLVVSGTVLLSAHSAAQTNAPSSAANASGPRAERASDFSNSMFEQYFHTYNSDYQFYFMRNRARINNVLVSASVDQSLAGATDGEIKAFLPLYYGETFSFILPFYFYRYALAPEQRHELPYDAVQKLFWQAIFNAELSDSLLLVLITESRHNGTEETQFNRIGTDLGEFVLLSWDVFDELTIAPGGRVKVQWQGKGRREVEIRPAGHVIYRPRPDLSLVTGVPSLFGLEWAGPGIDVATHVTLADGNIDAMCAVRVHMTGGFAVTLRFLRGGYEALYVPGFELDRGTGADTVNQIAQYEDRAQLELELRLSENNVIQLKAGYGYDEGVRLSNDGTEIAKIDGQNALYFGTTFVSEYNLDR